MNRLRKALLSKGTSSRLKEHGLLLDVNWDDEAPNPDIDSKATFVYDAPSDAVRNKENICLADHNYNINAAVAHYCKEILTCDVDEIFWLPIYEDGDDYINYSTEPFYDSELSGVVGFVYAKKDSDLFSTEREYHDYFTECLRVKSEWRNNRAFHFYLITDGADEIGSKGGIVIEKGGVYTSSFAVGPYMNTADETANKMIDQAIDIIDRANSQIGGTINANSPNHISTLVVELTVDQSKVPDGIGVTRYIINEIEKRCKTKVAIGSFNFVEERGYLTLNFLFSGLPLLSKLESWSSESLVDEIQANQRECATEEARMTDTIDKMLNAESYEEYDSYMVMALIRALFGTPDGVTMNIAHRKEAE